jgi:hypothetical protein
MVADDDEKGVISIDTLGGRSGKSRSLTAARLRNGAECLLKIQATKIFRAIKAVVCARTHCSAP